VLGCRWQLVAQKRSANFAACVCVFSRACAPCGLGVMFPDGSLLHYDFQSNTWSDRPSGVA
jgi:hypothetical protein